jgi:2-hydroxyethylphosphonate dioxygenase
MTKKFTTIDILKLNHWLNARKITKQHILVKSKSLYKKISTNKNFDANFSEIRFLEEKISIPLQKITVKEKLPDYIFWSSEKVKKTKRAINRDGIHFYNYYSLPTPPEFIGPVILDILCPKDKMPKLNNGHLEQAITVNLGPSDIFGRWGIKKNKLNFSKMKFNASKKNSWIIGDTYVEPAYCPHSYSRATNVGSQILSYTAKSPIEKFVKSLNNCSKESYKNLVNYLKKNEISSVLLNFYLENRAINFKYLSKVCNIKIVSLKQILKNEKLLKKVCVLLNIDHTIFMKKKYTEDKIGKTYMSYTSSFKTIRKYKSYYVSSMASTPRYPDLYGLYVKVNNFRLVKDFLDYTCSHYLVTNGNLKLNINNKKILLKKGDAIWVSSFKMHGFSGKGSLMKLVNGENVDSNDMNEISKLYNPLKTLSRSYKDEKSWGYD